MPSVRHLGFAMPRGAGLAQRPRSGLALRRVASLWAGVGQRACRPTRNATSSRELAPVSPGWSPPVRSLPRGERSLSLLPQAVLPTQAGPESAVWRCAPLCFAHRLAAYTADGSRQISRGAESASGYSAPADLPPAARALAAPGPRQVSGQARNADQSRLGGRNPGLPDACPEGCRTAGRSAQGHPRGAPTLHSGPTARHCCAQATGRPGTRPVCRLRPPQPPAGEPPRRATGPSSGRGKPGT